MISGADKHYNSSYSWPHENLKYVPGGHWFGISLESDLEWADRYLHGKRRKEFKELLMANLNHSPETLLNQDADGGDKQ